MNKLKHPSLKTSCLARPAIDTKVIRHGRYSYNGKDARHTAGQQKIRSYLSQDYGIKKQMQLRLFYDYCAKGLRVETSRQEYERGARQHYATATIFILRTRWTKNTSHFPLTQSCNASPINGLAPLCHYSAIRCQKNSGVRARTTNMRETDDHHYQPYDQRIDYGCAENPRSPIVRQGPTRRVLGVLNADALRSHARRQHNIAPT